MAKKFFSLTRVFAAAGLLFIISPKTVQAETWGFPWSQGGQSGTHTFASKSTCDNAHAQWLRAMRGMRAGGRAGPCRQIGGSSSPPSRPNTGVAARPKPPSGPTAAERRNLMDSRQRENERAQRNAQQRDAARQREFERGKASLLDDLDGPDATIVGEQDIGGIDSPAMRQLVCSASRTHSAIDSYNSGDYQTAIRLSRASVGEAQSAAGCTVAGIDIPDVPKPVAEIDFTEGMKRFQEVEDEITETIEVLARAEIDKEKAKETTARREIQVDRQETLVERLENAPDSKGKEEGLEKANDLLAKARAMLAKAITAEDAADERLRELDGERERLCTVSNDLSETLKREKTSCQTGGTRE